MSIQRTIVVNGYPLRFSGALQILKQFINSVELYSLPTDKYYIFIDSSLHLESSAKNIEFVHVKQNFLAKALFYFNFVGLRRLLIKRGIKANKVISLANVNSWISDDIESYVYFHQSLTVYENKWSFLNKEERSLFLYLKYYKWIIQKSLKKRTTIITQLDCIRDRVSKSFNVNKERILKVSPNVIIPEFTYKNYTNIDTSSINCIYPATPFKYKNHKILFDALNIISSSYSMKIKLYLTCNHSEFNACVPDKDNIEIIYLGHISFDVLMSLYQKMDALLFPSYIESFGLPMIEAATTGIKVLASDTDFANEVLKNYDGVRYISPFNASAWEKEIVSLRKLERFTPIQVNQCNSWEILINKINK